MHITKIAIDLKVRIQKNDYELLKRMLKKRTEEEDKWKN